MAEKEKSKHYSVQSISGVDGPVGMDLGIWLRFATDEGEISLKLSHQDALALKQALRREKSIEIEPRKVVSDTADALVRFAGELAEADQTAADRLKGHAQDLRLASEHMPRDK